ncbi:MAG: carboxyltransferase domain-containing protein [Candidatus Pelagibacter bacterium]|nr:carboxyltransferase domain-containing protein [Candidatus Pelagibacter bacterium]MDA8532818.1 carboxyltransferase domain-containing protein [Candidatus Pelagibacter bacterium]|tara:strand:+ start:656 stop:1342 length:687 start_codon:yes stop_codon:yes gene_type:complete
MIKNISNLGDASVYCDFGSDVNEQINSNVICYFNEISKLVETNETTGINNIIPSYNKLIINFDLSQTTFNEVKEKILALDVKNQTKDNFKKIKIAICCDDEFGLDFNRILKITKLSKEEILNLSLNKEYFCYMTGFIAGMPFLGDINKDIRCNRLETPRLKVPKGSVGITEQFVNIYTFESPGGWNIIGNTPEKIFDNLNRKEPALIKPGDRVSFYQISKEEYLNWNE